MIGLSVASGDVNLIQYFEVDVHQDLGVFFIFNLVLQGPKLLVVKFFQVTHKRSDLRNVRGILKKSFQLLGLRTFLHTLPDDHVVFIVALLPST